MAPKGRSVTANDGNCLISVEKIFSDSTWLLVTVGRQAPKEFRDVRTNNRLTVRGDKTLYYIDVHGFRGNIVDLEVSTAPL